MSQLQAIRSKRIKNKINLPKSQYTLQLKINNQMLQEANLDNIPKDSNKKTRKPSQGKINDKSNKKNAIIKTDGNKNKSSNSKNLLSEVDIKIKTSSDTCVQKYENNSKENTSNKKNVKDNSKFIQNNNFFEQDYSSDNHSQNKLIESQNNKINLNRVYFNSINIEKQNYNKNTKRKKNSMFLKKTENIFTEKTKQMNTVETEKNKKLKEKFEDILLPDDEIDEKKLTITNNLKNTKFPNISRNPFMSKIQKKSLNLDMPSRKDLLLLKQSSNPNEKNNPNLNNPSSNPKTNTEISDSLNIENIYRKFLNAAKRGDKEYFLEIYNQINSLPDNKKIKNYQDENGNTALHYACDEGNIKIVEILIGLKCDPNIKNSSNSTPLHLSAKRGYFDISKKLIEFGALIDVEDSEKNSPLHYACQNNYIELIKYLLLKTNKINEKNIYDKTPRDLTTNPEIKNLLDEYINKNELKSKESKINDSNTSNKILITKTPKNDSNNLNKNLANSYMLIENNIKDELNKQKGQKNQKDKYKNTKAVTSKNSSKGELGHFRLNNSLNLYTLNTKMNTNDENMENKNDILKKENQNRAHWNVISIEKEKSNNSLLTNQNKDKKNSNIYFQNTNNINNNNININIYSIEGIKRSGTDCTYLDEHKKKDYQKQKYISLNESHHNNSAYINPNNSAITAYNKLVLKGNCDIRGKSQYKRRSSKKSKFCQKNTSNIFNPFDIEDKNNFNMNKTEESIIIDSKMSKNIKMPKEKQNNNSNINLNNSVNIGFADHENKKNNNSKLIQTTENLIFKTRHQIIKKNSKFKPTNTISELNTNMKAISPIKKRKKISNLNDANRNGTRISPTQQKSLIETSLSMEKISPTNFICLAQLGKGSFGEVYLVKKLNTEEKYAMKVLSKDRIMSQNLLKYAIAERNVLSTSNHPFIVKLNYAFQTSSRLFLVIEYCPNGDLSKHLVFEKRFKEERAKFYLCEVLLALEDLHKRDIIFRDLKPDNVVLDKDGHCKLTDFGLSKEGVGRDIYAQSFCGSIAYLAPEMLKKKGHTKAVDWYLLGVLFYEMLVGVTPYFTTRKEEIFYNIEFGDLKIPNFVSKEAAELLLRLLERNPAKRLGGGGRDALEIKEHPYFKDVDWKKIYEKKIKPPFFMNYMDKTIKFYHKPKLFANDEFLNKTENDKQVSNILKGWSFINPNESI